MFSRSDLDELVATDANPAVSICLPTHAAGREIRQDPTRLKSLLSMASERLAARRRKADAEALLAPAAALVTDNDFWRHQEQGLAVFLAPGFHRVHKLPIPVPEGTARGTERKVAEARTAGIDRFNALIGTGKAATNPEEVVKAAREARVDVLFLAGDGELWGKFDETSDRIIAHGSPVEGDTDLFNYAAVMTLRHKGSVMHAQPGSLPRSSQTAAILRYWPAPRATQHLAKAQ